jgi:hypothetical protein
MSKLSRIIFAIYNFISNNRGSINPTQNPPNNDTPSCVYIRKPKRTGGLRPMKSQNQKPPLKLINITQTADKSDLQTQITQKISKIITTEYNNS